MRGTHGTGGGSSAMAEDPVIRLLPMEVRPGDLVLCREGRRFLVEDVEVRLDPVSGSEYVVLRDNGLLPAVFYTGETVTVVRPRKQ